MLRSWLDVEEIRRFCPSREFFEKHALTIPVFGIALPLGAGWLLLKSMIEDRRLAAKRTQMERAAIEILRQAIVGRLPEIASRRPRIARHVRERLREGGRNLGLIAPGLGCGGQI